MVRTKFLKISLLFSAFSSLFFANISFGASPDTIRGFTTAYPTAKSIMLIWTAPGVDGKTGTSLYYDIRYSVVPLTTETGWNNAKQVTENLQPQPIGSAETLMVTGLASSTKYYFGIRAGNGLSAYYEGTTLAVSDVTAPATITNLATSLPTAKSITLTWTSPGDDGKIGVASRYIPYDIRYSTSPITDANWESSTKVIGEATALAANQAEIFKVSGLSPLTKYYFAIKTSDQTSNWSALSNSPSGTTATLTDSIAPNKITDLRAVNITPTTITLLWTLPAGVNEYDIRYSTSPITSQAAWESATAAPHQYPKGRKLKGTNSSYIFRGLSPANQYYFAIKSADAVPNWSELSNSAGVVTLPKAATPNNKLLFHEGMVFPNPSLAPVNPPYISFWMAGPGEQPHETSIVSIYKYMSKTDMSWHNNMVAKGKLPIPFTNAIRNDPLNTDPWYLDTEEEMYAINLEVAQRGFYGVQIDEWASWEVDDRVVESIRAFRRVKQQFPNFFVSTAYYGDAFDPTMNGATDIVDFFVPEIYIYPGTDFRDKIKRYALTIKEFGVEGENIPIFSGRNTYAGMPEDLDLWIKYLRALSPQMAGLGAGVFKLYEPEVSSMRPLYDKVIQENFVDLAPAVVFVSPENNSTVNGTITISVSATPNTKTKRPVVNYRYFIDKTLVKISSSPNYSWNTAGYTKGVHILTVHAVADDYLAGVNQIKVSTEPAVLNPTFSPDAGTYDSTQDVTISSATADATIYYTLDGTDPASSSTRAIYASAIPVSGTKTIKAKAFKDGLPPSVTVSATYTINLSAAAAPSFSPAAGTYTTAQDVSISTATAGATIHYTRDGTSPTEASPIYSTPINISSNTNLRAGAWKTGMTPSSITSAAYTISGSVNLLINPGFESGTTSWNFFTSGTGKFGTISPGYAENNAAKIALSSSGTNIQLFQTGIPLAPNTRYRLSFAAYSSSGKDLTVILIKHVSPNTNYGLTFTPNLGTGWQEFSTEFTTSGFTTNVNDGRLFFWFAPFAAAGDTYYIDNITLETVIAPPIIPSINLAPNPGFETDPSVNYAYYGTGTFTWANDYFHTGSKSLKIVSSQATGLIARWMSKINNLSATAGKSYTASVWMKTNNVSRYGELLINFWDANLAYLNKYYISNHLTGTTGWSQLSVSGIAPANTKYIRAEFRLYGPGTIWVDDVELK